MKLQSSPGGYCSSEAYSPTGTIEDGSEANEVMESGNEFHSVIVIVAKDS